MAELDKIPQKAYIGFHCVGTWLSLVEHSVRDAGVARSNRAVPTTSKNTTRKGLRKNRNPFLFSYQQKNKSVVGARGFEPPTSCSQSRSATRLRHAPISSFPQKHARLKTKNPYHCFPGIVKPGLKKFSVAAKRRNGTAGCRLGALSGLMAPKTI